MADFFSVLWRSAKAECATLIRRPEEWVTGLLMPVLWCVLFMAIFSTGIVHKLPVGFVDMDQSALSRSVVTELTALPSVKALPFASPADADAALRSRETYATVILPSGYEKDNLRGSGAPVRIDINKSFYAVGTLLEADLKNALADLKVRSGVVMRTQSGGTFAANAERLRASLPEVYFLGNAGFDFGGYLPLTLVPGLLALGCALAAAGSLTREWRDKTIPEWLDAVDRRPVAGLLGKLLPWLFFYTVAGLLWISVFSGWLGWGVEGSLARWALSTVLLMAASLGLALFFAGISPTWVIAVTGVVCLLAPTFPLTGFSYPLEAMSAYARAVGELLPLTHYLRAQAADWLLNTQGAAVWREIGWLAAFAFLTGAAGLAFAAKRLLAKGTLPVHDDTPTFTVKPGFWSTWVAAMRGSLLNRDTFAVFAGGVAFYLVFYGWPYQNQQIEHVPVVVADLDSSPLSRRLTQELDAAPVTHLVAVVHNEATLEKLIREQTVDVGIVIPAGYEKNLVRGDNVPVHLLASGAFPVKGRAVQAALAGVLTDNGRLMDNTPLASGLPPEKILAASKAGPALDVRYRFNEISGYGNYTVPAVGPLIVQAVMLMGVTMVLGGWLRTGAPEFLRRALARPHVEGLAFFLAYACVAGLWLLYAESIDFQWHEYGTFAQPALVVALCLLFACALSSFSLAVALLLRSNAVSSQAVVMVSAPILFMSGVIWPLESIDSPVVHLVGALVPSSPAIRALLAASQDGATFVQVAPAMMHLALLTLMYAAIARCAAKRALRLLPPESNNTDR